MLTGLIVDTVRFRGADWPSEIEVVDAERGSVVLFEKVRGVKCANKECGKRHLWRVVDGDDRTVCSACWCGDEIASAYGEAIYRCVAAHVNATMRKGTIADRVKGVKVCAKCGVERALAEFASDAKRMDGLSCRCLLCKPPKTERKREQTTSKPPAKQQAVGVGDEQLYIKSPKHGIPGVVLMRDKARTKPWKAEFTVGGVKKYFGCYATPIEAGLAVFDSVKELTGVDLWDHWHPQERAHIALMREMMAELCARRTSETTGKMMVDVFNKLKS
jgi:hypothetical protein